MSTDRPRGFRYSLLLTLGALGVVFGDIGTSPLYAFRECFSGDHGIAATPDNVIGVVSLIFWAIIIVVSIKYLIFILAADNRGEGGELALMTLALQRQDRMNQFQQRFLVICGLCGAALLCGDGIITPAISVLSAVEGLKVVTPFFQPYITSITVLILVVLFAVQKSGTGRVGVIFGPVMILWFVTIGVLGIPFIFEQPKVLTALNPWYGLRFLIGESGQHGLLTLGSVFLAVTGAEALYADMGHFGKKPIRHGWLFVALPGLVFNYFGQGALILSDPSAVENPFYRLAPGWGLIPLVGLATFATVIASQALISGAFSIISQAVQLGYLPRLQIKHTSPDERGQIYIPFVNWSLLIGAVILVKSFHDSSSLAAAYGVGVATTMVITTIMVSFVARYQWEWSLVKTLLIFGVLLLIDVAFFVSNGLKFWHGGWVPIVIGICMFTLMTTWWTGRNLLWQRMKEHVLPFKEFFAHLRPETFTRIDGSAVFMIRDLKITPPALIYNIRHNRVLHTKVILLSVVTDEHPHYEEHFNRVEVQDLGGGFYRVIVHYGFMENPNVPRALSNAKLEDYGIDLSQTTFFLDRVIPIPTDRPGMSLWRERLFALLSQNALRATAFYQIPAEQVIEIGFQIEI